MHTIKFPLVTGKEKEKILAKGFRAMARFHNIMVREARRRLWHLQNDPEYQQLRIWKSENALLSKQQVHSQTRLWTCVRFKVRNGECLITLLV